MAAELTDDIRVPLDSLHADALYLASRVAQGTMSAVRLSQVIRERIDAAKAALATQQAAQGAEPVAEVCPGFDIRWAGSEPIAFIIARHRIKVGTKLYTAPPPTADVEKEFNEFAEFVSYYKDQAVPWQVAELFVRRIRAALQSDQAQAGKGV